MSDIPMASVGSLNPSTEEWTAMGQGVRGAIETLAACGDKIVVGGTFSEAGGEASHNIALLELPGSLIRDSFDQ